MKGGLNAVVCILSMINASYSLQFAIVVDVDWRSRLEYEMNEW